MGKMISREAETELYWNQIVNLYGGIWDSYWNNGGKKHDKFRFLVELINASYLYQSAMLEGARQQWTTFGTVSLALGVTATIMAVLFSAWAMARHSHHRRPTNSYFSFHHGIWRLPSSLIRPETAVWGIFCGVMFSDCLSVLESTAVRFTYSSYVICLTMMAVARNNGAVQCSSEKQVKEFKGQGNTTKSLSSFERFNDVLLNIPLWRYTPLYVSYMFFNLIFIFDRIRGLIIFHRLYFFFHFRILVLCFLLLS